MVFGCFRKCICVGVDKEGDLVEMRGNIFVGGETLCVCERKRNWLKGEQWWYRWSPFSSPNH